LIANLVAIGQQRSWHVRHVENFITSQNDRKIKQLAANDLQRYFEALGRECSRAKPAPTRASLDLTACAVRHCE
jgi:hypothetical protein